MSKPLSRGNDVSQRRPSGVGEYAAGIKEPAGAEKLDHTGFVGVRYYTRP